MPSFTKPFTQFRILLIPAIAAFIYLYFYPAINDCAFAPAARTKPQCDASGCKDTTVNAGLPPFRLLALADPQLEGDTSLPSGWNDGASANLKRIGENVFAGRWDILRRDLPVLLQGYRKKLDLWGNDRYLANVYRQTRWWAAPTHTVVLGDLLGSQWIGDEEFERRARRFWSVVFGGAEKVPKSVTAAERRVEVLGEDKSWKRRVIAVAGNHDVGYAGDLSEERIERFERSFGKANWEISFRLPNASLDGELDYASKKTPDFYAGPGPQPKLRLVILNSMNLDEPTRSPAMRVQSLEFMSNSICDSDRIDTKNTATVLLTHIPLHKANGVCVDGPFFSYFSPENGGGIAEQNHLSEDVTHQIFDCLLRNKPAVVLNGHDHEGCDTQHYHNPENIKERKTIRHNDLPSLTPEEKQSALREITVRSMMGSYGGYAGFLSGWYNEDQSKWEFAYETCGFGVQHIWWVCTIVLCVEIGLAVMSGMDALTQKLLEPKTRRKVKEA